VIEFERVSKRFGGARGAQALAVSEFSLQVPSRQITVLVGSSGSGKTTLLRMVNRMVEPDSGRVLIDGVDVASLNAVSLRRSIGYVMQQIGLLPHKTAYQNVELVARISGQSRDEAAASASEMLELVGLDAQQVGRYPAELSGGQQQRVGVARALSVKPNILLMDEPFAAVDPIVRAELQQELKRIQRALGVTVLFVTHDRDEALALADQLVVLENGGEIAQAGSPEAIIAAPANEFVAKLMGLDDRAGGR
jgi:osmoprotectant transport system ATP-binding protein